MRFTRTYYLMRALPLLWRQRLSQDSKDNLL